MLVNGEARTSYHSGNELRLTNIGDIELVLVEMQVGYYNGDDDIERLEDAYGRN